MNWPEFIHMVSRTRPRLRLQIRAPDETPAHGEDTRKRKGYALGSEISNPGLLYPESGYQADSQGAS